MIVLGYRNNGENFYDCLKWAHYMPGNVIKFIERRMTHPFIYSSQNIVE